MNKKTLLWIVLAVAVLVGIYLIFSSQTPETTAPMNMGAPTTKLTTPTPQQTAAPVQGGTVQVDIRGFAFVSATVRIAPGTKIVWKNDDDVAHQVIGAGFSSPVLYKGQTYSHVFTQEGEFPYYCGIHPYMKGEIIVRSGTF